MRRLWEGGHKESVWAASRIKQENAFSCKAGSSTPGQHQLLGIRQVTCYLLPVRNWAAHQQVSSGRVSEASSALTATPPHSYYFILTMK